MYPEPDDEEDNTDMGNSNEEITDNEDKESSRLVGNDEEADAIVKYMKEQEDEDTGSSGGKK